MQYYQKHGNIFMILLGLMAGDSHYVFRKKGTQNLISFLFAPQALRVLRDPQRSEQSLWGALGIKGFFLRIFCRREGKFISTSCSLVSRAILQYPVNTPTSLGKISRIADRLYLYSIVAWAFWSSRNFSMASVFIWRVSSSWISPPTSSSLQGPAGFLSVSLAMW